MAIRAGKFEVHYRLNRQHAKYRYRSVDILKRLTMSYCVYIAEVDPSTSSLQFQDSVQTRHSNSARMMQHADCITDHIGNAGLIEKDAGNADDQESEKGTEIRRLMTLMTISTRQSPIHNTQNT